MNKLECNPKSYVCQNIEGQWSIKCKYCEMVSHNTYDVVNHYCGFCKLFHDDNTYSKKITLLHSEERRSKRIDELLVEHGITNPDLKTFAIKYGERLNWFLGDIIQFAEDLHHFIASQDLSHQEC